jgi:hypothetical protein
MQVSAAGLTTLYEGVFLWDVVILVPGGGGSGALQRTMCLGLQGRVGGRVGVSGLLWGCEIATMSRRGLIFQLQLSI